jgi:signal transduction histidine kinase/CheY-like chemotaxis protein
MTVEPPSILVADDEPFLRALVRATLGAGYRLIEARDGAEALDLARERRPSVALIDGQMPFVDGFAVCRQLKSDPSTAGISIIMLTARSSPADKVHGREAGADGYLTKPFSPARLLEAVEEALSTDSDGSAQPRDEESSTPSAPPLVSSDGEVMTSLDSEVSPEIAQTLAYARELGSLYESARTQAAHFRQLVEISRELVSARGPSAVLRLGLDRAVAFSGYESGSVLLVDPQNGELAVDYSLGPGPTTGSVRVDAQTQALARQSLQDRRPLQLEGTPDRPELAYSLNSAPSAICLPLVTPGGDAIGVLALQSHSQPRPLDAHDLDALQLLAAQLAASVESAELHDKLRDLIGRLLVAQEEERRRIAYDVHDGLAQVAAGAHQHLQAFARKHRPRTTEARDDLERALSLVQRTVRETRQVIADLRPTALDDFGLATALRLELERLEAQGWSVSYESSLGQGRVPAHIETALFRVAQEALSNVRKHAQTTSVEVKLELDDGVLRMEIVDFGRGFDSSETRRMAGPGERVGLPGMHERIALLGGRCTVRSTLGAGTRVTAEVPVPTARPVAARPAETVRGA